MNLSGAQRILAEMQLALNAEQARKEKARSTIGFYNPHDTLALIAPNTQGYQIMLPLKCPIGCAACEQERA